MRHLADESTASPALTETQVFTLPARDRRDEESRAQGCLCVHDSPFPGEFGTYFVLFNERTVIGREPSCTVRLQSDSVSRRHAVLTTLPSSRGLSVQLENLSDKAGWTTVEGQQSVITLKQGEKTALQPGDKIRLGAVTLDYDVFYDLPIRLQENLDRAVELMRQGEHAQAQAGLAAIGRYRPAGGSGSSPLERILAAARYYEARIDSLAGRWGRACEIYDALLANAAVAPLQRVKVNYHRGIISLYQNNLQEALQLARAALAQSEREALVYGEAMALCLTGMTEARLRHFGEAVDAFRRATEAVLACADEARKRPEGMGHLSERILLESAIASYLNDRHDEAVEQLRPLLGTTGSTPVSRSIRAEALRARGVIRSVRRDFAGAYADLSEALRIFVATRARFLECKAHKSLALNYLSWGRLEEAEFHLQQCMDLLLKEVENPYERAVVAGHLGKIALARGNAGSALQWFEREQGFQAGVPGISHSEAYTHRNFARAHRDLNAHEKSIEHYELAAKGFGQNGNLLQSGLTLVELTGEYLTAGDVDAAEECLARVETAFAATERGAQLKPSLMSLQARVAWARGDSNRAMELFKASAGELSADPPSYPLAETYLHYGRAHGELHRRLMGNDPSAAAVHLKEALSLLGAGLRCAESQQMTQMLALFEKELRSLDASELIRLRMGRFLNQSLVDVLQDDRGPALIGDHLTDCTILFADLSGYTAMVERTPLDEIKRVLNEFFGTATRIVRANGGTIEKFIGDCAMAVFKGATRGIGLSNQGVAAVKSALEIAHEVEQLSQRLAPIIGRKLSVTAGICTGPVLVGCFGTPQQMDFTLIGDAVNVASRLQALAQPGEIALSSETYRVFMQGGVAPWTTNREALVAKVKNRERPVEYWLVDRAMTVKV